MVLGTVFGITLLCAIVPCEVNFDPPQVSIGSQYFSGGVLKNEYPVVDTNYGKIRGYSMATLLGNRVHAFEGIRFAVPPIGNLRFRDPVPSGSWTGIYSAFKPGPRCIQTHPGHAFQVVGKEDCLFLNIYSPNIPESSPEKFAKNWRKIPVVVFLHGGSFLFGGGHEYGPAYITDQNIILVTVNYRMGVYGFMSTGDAASPGNYGLKDQALALKWVHENIGHFGGDPNQVTLMGQSAGGVSTHLHMISNRTREYFRSAVSLSSSAFLHWAVQRPCHAKFWTNWLADLVKCPKTTESTHALVECFRNKNPQFLVAYSVRLLKWFVFPPVLFAPVVEFDHPGAFLKDTVVNHYKTGNVAKKPWYTGLTSQEGYTYIYFLQLFLQYNFLRRNFSKYQAIVLNYDHELNKTMTDTVNHKIQQFYFGDETPENVPTSKFAQVMTDRYFSNGQVTAIKAHAAVAPTYPFYYDYIGSTNTGRLLGAARPEWGVGHGEDMFNYLNGSTYYAGLRKNTQDFELSQVMLNLLGNFVRKGVPYYTEKDGTDSSIWAVQKPLEEVQFLNLGKSIKMISNPLTERIQFWKTLGIPDVTPFESSNANICK